MAVPDFIEQHMETHFAPLGFSAEEAADMYRQTEELAQRYDLYLTPVKTILFDLFPLQVGEFHKRPASLEANFLETFRVLASPFDDNGETKIGFEKIPEDALNPKIGDLYTWDALRARQENVDTALRAKTFDEFSPADIARLMAQHPADGFDSAQTLLTMAVILHKRGIVTSLPGLEQLPARDADETTQHRMAIIPASWADVIGELTEQHYGGTGEERAHLFARLKAIKPSSDNG